MADKTIPDLDDATLPLADADVFEVSQGGVSKKAAKSAVSAGPAATDSDVWSAASNKAIQTAALESASAFQTLTDAATVAVDWDAGINFTLTVTDDRVIGNPSNGQPGTFRNILVQGNDATDRTITFDTQYEGDLPAITDCDSGKWYLLTIMCLTTSHFIVSAKQAL